MSVLVRELLDLPEHVSKGDYVQSLAAGLGDPEDTVAKYAVTPELVQSFHEALATVSGALASGRSQPVYLHGSFGSGKSHFMAVLDLVLQGHDAPWRKPELHPLRAEFDWIGRKRLLQLPFHMLGAESLEEKIFGGYVAFVREQHPDAELPGLFRDRDLFANAESLRLHMGDDAFFGALNRGKQAVAGFGALGAVAPWTPESFEAAVRSADPAERRRLFSDLTRTLLSAFVKQTDRFVDFDEGLAELTRHAAGLGYDGVVLYLDELILWLAGRSADLPMVQREIQKLVKLKEAQDERRALPIVAFIARQRDLRHLVGDSATGSERAHIEQVITHNIGRFAQIDLADSNLRAIVPHRVVVPRTPADRARMDEAFEALWREAEEAAPTLLAGDATKPDWRQVFPFSPALVDVLIALSDRLQRERTAIRILVEMLVEHLQDLKLGQVVPVGDVFDVVASAEDAVDGASRAAFQRARELYRYKLMPLLRVRHGTDDPSRCQRMRPGHPDRIGCSNCPMSECRNDQRLVKTVLLAALVPKARPFDGLTVKRLVDLNHGTVHAPLESMKVDIVAGRLRDLARDVHQLRIADAGDDPSVKVSLESVDLQPILDRANEQDTRARRRYVLRRILFEQLGLQDQGDVVSHSVTWRETRRTGRIRFGNVRVMRADELRCPDDTDWQVVIDYPFDEVGYTPLDDERRVEDVRRELGGRGTSTVVWLPTFFSDRVLQDLGALARLEHILEPRNLAGFLSHLPPDEHGRARTDLQSLHDRKRFDVVVALCKAYGIQRRLPDEPLLDLDRSVEDHVISLDEQVSALAPTVGRLDEAVSDLAHRLLDVRYPHHPRFKATPSPQRLQRIRELMEKLLEHHDAFLPMDRTERDDLSRIAEPLHLCRVVEPQVERIERVFTEMDARRQQANDEEPTVGRLRRYLDPERRMGLQEPVANLVAWLWGVWAKRTPMAGRQPAEWPSNARLSEHVVFTEPDLPDEAAWNEALRCAGAVFGVAPRGKALNPANVAHLASALRKQRTQAGLELPRLLRTRLAEFAPAREAPRLRTAEDAIAMIRALEPSNDRALVEALAAVRPATSLPALQRSLASAAINERELAGQSFAMFGLVHEARDDERVRERARTLLDALARALAEDELNVPLAGELARLGREAAELLKRPDPPAEGWRRIWAKGPVIVDAGEAEVQIDALRRDLLDALNGLEGAPGRVTLQVVVEKREGGS